MGLERAPGLKLALGICACPWLDTDAGREDDGDSDENEGEGGLGISSGSFSPSHTSTAGVDGLGGCRCTLGKDEGGGGIGREGEGGTVLCGGVGALSLPGTGGVVGVGVASHAVGLRSLRARTLASESLLLPAPWLLRLLLFPPTRQPSRSTQSGARKTPCWRAASSSCGEATSLCGRWYAACPLWVRRTGAWAALLLCADGGAPLVVCGRRAVPTGVLERVLRGTLEV